ncbi:MAG: hypothetical protein PHT59_00755 [Candidatus Omnitrophica bacterium]|nr:hypothetical protein [Candidatus Omnitrophota bacterium]
MASYTTKSLREIEERLSKDSGADPMRVQALESAKHFKTSWVELGRALYAVWKDRRFKEWGYAGFDAYTAREIGIRKATAMKLLRSYYFLEKEEPDYLRPGYRENRETSRIPSYESIDVLRRAKGKKELDGADYSRLKNEIFEKGVEARQVQKDLTQLMRQRRELEPEEAWEEKRAQAVKRLVGLLSSIKDQVKGSKLISAQLVRETETLIKRLQEELAT